MTRARLRLGGNYRKLYAATALSNIGDGMSAIAYPWLASAVTRNPILVAVIAAAQRLPWLVFTLPAGVITDRVDRKRAMVLMDSLRFVFTLLIAFAVFGAQDSLPKPDEVQSVVGTRAGLYVLLVIATLLLGCAEVLRDNSNQTFLPSIVAPEHLEHANGRIWSIESIANQFVGPPLGSLLLMVAFSAPFFVDAGSFFAAAALVALIPGMFRAERPEGETSRPHWRSELKEGFGWLWRNEVLRAMAVALGVMNLATNMSGAVFVLFAQDVLQVTPFTFTLMGFGGALGGIIGGYTAPRFSKRFGSGASLAISVGAFAVCQAVIGLITWWPLVALSFGVGVMFSMLWNVITVSFRQTIIPSHLLGRVNSVYRFFGWGMIPIGAVLGGLFVAVMTHFVSRNAALRLIWFVDGGIHLVLLVFVLRVLTTEKIEAMRAAAAPDAARLGG
ncbi:MAG: MFS transporter [Ilumatobacteraceae bacterium]